MAERVLKSLLKKRGIHGVEVASAGLMDMQGTPADKTARQVLQEHGIEEGGHQSRLLADAMVADSDLIVAMERRQLLKIAEQYPEIKDKLRLLKSYLPGPHGDGAGEDVQDPYRRSLFHYRLCYAEISLAMEELIKCI